MKKISMAKIASLIFVCVMLFVALTMGVCADEAAESTVPNDVFQFKGYSMSEEGDACFGFTLNHEAKDALGESADIGIVIVSYDNSNGGAPLNADGTPASDKVLKLSLNGYKNTSYNFKLVNFTEVLQSRKYVIAPYVCDGTSVYYYENGNVSETVTGVSYNDIVIATCEHADENGDYQCDKCSTLVLPEEGTVLTIEQALKIGALTTTEQKYYVTGTITEVVHATYGNVYITDGTNTIYIYGLYSEDGETRYDAMEYKPVASDQITVYSIVTSYSGTPQLKNAWLDEVVKHECDYSEATCKELATCSICEATTGELADHNYVEGKCEICGLAEGVSTADKTYTFSNYTAGTQYAKNEDHVLDENTVMITNDAHFTSELRLYSSSSNNAYAIIKSVNAISKIAVNAGNKVDVLVVYGSNDEGATWTPVAEISVTTSSYKDYTADLDGNYKWIKLDVKGTNQVRIKNFTLTTVICSHLSTETNTTDATCTENGYEITTCTACGAIVGEKVKVEDAHHNYEATVTDPTCLEDGFTTYTCAACGDTYNEEGEAALGHTYENGACIRCGLAEVHEHNYEAVVTDPTCTEKGYTTYTCACEESYVDNYVNALGHADTDNNYKCDACSTRMAPEANSVLTIAQAITLGKTFTKDSYTTDKYYISGTILEITNTTFGNVYISDGTNKILVYGLYSADGTISYSAMSPKPVMGEEVTVYGTIGYYTEAQMKNGWVTEHTPHECDFSEATCEAPATCSICKVTNGEKADHNMVDGVCTVCGYVEGTAEAVELNVSFADAANRTTYTTSQQIWEQNGIKITNNKASSTSNVGDYKNPARFYKGSSILVEVEGKTITKIVFNCNTASYATALQSSIVAADGVTVSVSGKAVTIEFATAVDSYTIASLTGGQVRVDSISVFCI